jgi:hypothetical protein
MRTIIKGRNEVEKDRNNKHDKKDTLRRENEQEVSI